MKIPESASITLVSVGKLGREADAHCEALAKELGIRLVTIPDFPDTDPKVAVRKESDAIIEKIENKGRIFLMDPSGHDTPDMMRLSHGENIIVIGGSNGVDARVAELSYQRVSLGKLTYPHKLAKLVVMQMISSFL